MIQTPAILDSYRSMADGTIKVVFSTQDAQMFGAEIIQLLANQGKYGYLAFKEGQDKVPEGALDGVVSHPKPSFMQKGTTGQSPSKKLKSAIYVLWEKSGKEGDFEDTYKRIIGKFHQMILAEIDKGE